MYVAEGGILLVADLINSETGGDRWVVGHLRATTFIPDLTAIDDFKSTWWKNVVGNTPEDERINHQGWVREQEGMLDGNLLTMVCRHGRVDWVLKYVEQGSPYETSKLPGIGPMSPKTLNPFMEVIRKWLFECPPTNRLAFGAILGRRATDAQAGYEKILSYISDVQLEPQGISDLVYQINRPRKSGFSKDIMINRLSRWSVQLTGTVGITVDPTIPKASASMQGQHICKLDLDINTTLLDDAVSGDDAHTIFLELVSLGQEISTKGDIP